MNAVDMKVVMLWLRFADWLRESMFRMVSHKTVLKYYDQRTAETKVKIEECKKKIAELEGKMKKGRAQEPSQI